MPSTPKFPEHACDHLITFNGEVWRIPESAVQHDYNSPVVIPFDKFQNMTGNNGTVMHIDTFMAAADVGPAGYQGRHVLVVKTKAGYVWCTRICTQVPLSESKAMGLNERFVGFNFLWPWYPAKAKHAWQQAEEQFRKDGIFRPLCEMKPALNGIVSACLDPRAIEGARLVPFNDLAVEDQYFIPQLRVCDGLSAPRYATDSFNERSLTKVKERQKSHPLRANLPTDRYDIVETDHHHYNNNKISSLTDVFYPQSLQMISFIGWTINTHEDYSKRPRTDDTGVDIHPFSCESPRSSSLNTTEPLFKSRKTGNLTPKTRPQSTTSSPLRFDIENGDPARNLAIMC
tara:strand:+ start:3486 stop:4517 length:1032 start_codon:yes stop_codon:yes gene_type:complete